MTDHRIRTIHQDGKMNQSDFFDVMQFVSFILVTIVGLSCLVLGIFFLPDHRPTLAFITATFTVVTFAVNAGIRFLCFNPNPK